MIYSIRGKPVVRITMEFSGEGLCFDDAHGDFGPSALTNVEDLLKGMVFSILEHKMLATLSYSKESEKIPKHHTKKRRDYKALYELRMKIYEKQQAIVENAIKTARYDIATNWNWETTRKENHEPATATAAT